MFVLAGFATGQLATFIILLIGPLLEDQIGALINAAPNYVEKARGHLIPWFENWLTRFSPEDMDKIRSAASNAAGDAAGIAGKAIHEIVSGSLALIDVMALLIITPVVAFYMMRDWPAVTDAVDSLIPRRQYGVIKEQLGPDRCVAFRFRARAGAGMPGARFYL